jgi:uncharacterized protein YihD (DUF1040 family)
MTEPLLKGAEKQARIDALREINKLGREAGFDKNFCDMVDGALLLAEDVPTADQ